jgi:hypothetical protein
MGAPMRIWLTPAKRTLARRISDWLGVEAGVAAITLVRAGCQGVGLP